MTAEQKSYFVTLKVPDWKDDEELDTLIDHVYELCQTSKLEHIQDIFDGPISCGKQGYFAWLVNAAEENIKKWAGDVVSELSRVIPEVSLDSITPESSAT